MHRLLRSLARILPLVLALGLGGGAGQGALAAPAPPLHVVKLISFDCPVCRASEVLDEPLRQAVRAGGGQFVVAPLPRSTTNNARERFYYALRDAAPTLEPKTREALYRGAQDLGYPLADDMETLDWLRQDLGEDATDWNRLLARAAAPEATDPITRALRLTVKAGAQLTPTYLVVRDGQVIGSFDTSTVPGGSLSLLRDAVLNALRAAPTPTKE